MTKNPTKVARPRPTVEEAIAETMIQEGADPSTGARLRYYPKESGNQTIKQLISWESPD